MSRSNRCDDTGSWHHVVNRAIARRPLFEDASDIRYFLSRVAREVRRGRLEVHAWCVLTTHFHLLVRSRTAELSEAMRRIQNEYVRHFNRRHRRDGTLVRGRFSSKPVKSLEYRRAVLRYIDANPVAARLAASPFQYPWCSAAQYSRAVSPKWLERSWVERQVADLTDGGAFSPENYAAALHASIRAGFLGVVEARIDHGGVADDLDDLIGSAPARVREWMERKARLADGTEVGLPVCDTSSIEDAESQLRATDGEWTIDRNGRVRDGWTPCKVGVLRVAVGLTWARVAAAVGRSTASCHADFAVHCELVCGDSRYAERASRWLELALSICHGARAVAGSASRIPT